MSDKDEHRVDADTFSVEFQAFITRIGGKATKVEFLKDGTVVVEFTFRPLDPVAGVSV